MIEKKIKHTEHRSFYLFVRVTGISDSERNKKMYPMYLYYY